VFLLFFFRKSKVSKRKLDAACPEMRSICEIRPRQRFFHSARSEDFFAVPELHGIALFPGKRRQVV
jgi:hypothetical protein